MSAVILGIQQSFCAFACQTLASQWSGVIRRSRDLQTHESIASRVHTFGNGQAE